MARGTDNVTGKFTTTSNPTSTSPTKKMKSKATKVTKAIVTSKETNQSNPTSIIQTKETSSSTTIAKAITMTKLSKATVMCIEKQTNLTTAKTTKESNNYYSNSKSNNDDKSNHSNSHVYRKNKQIQLQV